MQLILQKRNHDLHEPDLNHQTIGLYVLLYVPLGLIK